MAVTAMCKAYARLTPLKLRPYGPALYNFVYYFFLIYYTPLLQL